MTSVVGRNAEKPILPTLIQLLLDCFVPVSALIHAELGHGSDIGAALRSLGSATTSTFVLDAGAL
jgi:hypothetical protein